MSFVVRDRTDIAKAAASIGRALRNQYTIGYVPRGDGRERPVAQDQGQSRGLGNEGVRSHGVSLD